MLGEDPFDRKGKTLPAEKRPRALTNKHALQIRASMRPYPQVYVGGGERATVKIDVIIIVMIQFLIPTWFRPATGIRWRCDI